MKRPRSQAEPAQKVGLKQQEEVTPAWDWLGFFNAVPKDLGTPLGDTLNVAILRLLGNQMLAVCCRGSFDWCTAGGRRIILRLDEECRGPGGPYAPLERIDTNHVESVSLGRYGRKTPDECARLLAVCSNARSLRCVYSKLTGLGHHLAELAPRFCLRRTKLHQCRLEAADLAQLLRCAPHLESIDVYGESLAGLGEHLGAASVRCPEMRSIEFNDCELSADDAAAIFRCFGDSLHSAHIQAADLRGLQVPLLPALKTLTLLDCRLSRFDVVAVAARCPQLEALTVCGNPLGGSEGSVPFPQLSHLRSADFRNCELDSEDEAELRESLQACPHLEFRARPPEPSGAASRHHIVFEDSSDAEGE